MCLKNGKISIAGKYAESYITSQELACLRLLLQGFSHKMIAQTLDISVRTIETYLQKVKQRTGYVNLKELEKLLICP